MVLLAILLFIEILALSLISHVLTQRLFLFFLLLFRSRNVAVSALTLILFPGTVIHELSHLFTAEILGVRTGKLTLVPESIQAGHHSEPGEIQSGSVAIAKTGPFRRTLIGIAPTIIGLTGLIALSYYLPQFFQNTIIAIQNQQNILPSTFCFLLFAFCLFAISNTMFSSREDLKGVFPVLILLILIVSAIYLTGFRFDVTLDLEQKLELIEKFIAQGLGTVVTINFSILLLISGINRLLMTFSFKRRRLTGVSL